MFSYKESICASTKVKVWARPLTKSGEHGGEGETPGPIGGQSSSYCRQSLAGYAKPPEHYVRLSRSSFMLSLSITSGGAFRWRLNRSATSDAFRRTYCAFTSRNSGHLAPSSAALHGTGAFNGPQPLTPNSEMLFVSFRVWRVMTQIRPGVFDPVKLRAFFFTVRRVFRTNGARSHNPKT